MGGGISKTRLWVSGDLEKWSRGLVMRAVFSAASTGVGNTAVDAGLILCERRPWAHGSRRWRGRVIHSGRGFHGVHSCGEGEEIGS